MTDIFIVNISVYQSVVKKACHLKPLIYFIYLFKKNSDALSKSSVYLSVSSAAFSAYSPTVLQNTCLEQLADTFRETTGPCQHH